MKYSFLFLIVLIPITVFAATDIGKKIGERVIIIGGKLDPNTILKKGDAKLLGLNSNAKSFLSSRYKPTAESNRKKCVQDTNKAIKGLNTNFAECAARFLESWEKSGQGKIRITTAFRDNEDQRCVCIGEKGLCAKPGRSRHQRGDALDVTPERGNWNEFHAAAQRFGGVYFNLGMRDKVHLVAKNTTCGKGAGPGLNPNLADITNQGNYQPGGGGQQSQSPQRPEWTKETAEEAAAKAGTGGQQGGSGNTQPKGGAGTNGAGGSTNTNDPYNIWRNTDGSAATTVATLKCQPASISGSERALIEWGCSGESTRSRGGTTRKESKFITQGRLSGRGYARPSASTGYKLQCMQGDRVLAEAACAIDVTGQTTTSDSQTSTQNIRTLLHVSADEALVNWGSGTTILWASIGTDFCTLSGGGQSKSGPKGFMETGSLYNSTTYVLECDSKNGTKIKKVEVGIR